MSSSSPKKKTTIEDLKFDMEITALYHPIANQEPLMLDAIKKIAESMLNIGYRKDRPITKYEGQILDGRTRYVAAKAVGIKPIYTEFKGTEAEAQAESDSLNNARRHRTKSQNAMMAAYTVIDSREKIALEKEELREKNPGISTRFLNEKTAKSNIYVQIGGLTVVENVAKKYSVSKNYVHKCIKYLTYKDMDFSEMCLNIFNGELEIYQAEEKYQKARLSLASANRTARQLSEEESLLYQKIDLATKHPKSAAREIISLMQESEKMDELKEMLHNLTEEVYVLRAFTNDIKGNGKSIPLGQPRYLRKPVEASLA